MSGFPGLPFYPHLIQHLRNEEFDEATMHQLTHSNIEEDYGFKVPLLDVSPHDDLDTMYEVDVYFDARRKIGKATEK